MREALISAALLLGTLLGGCFDDDGKVNVPEDAGGSPSQDAAAVEYQGPTRGGAIPQGAELEPEPGDQGPFEVSEACCDATLSIAKEADASGARVVGDLPPLDGAGKEADVVSETFSATVCMPAGEAVRYRFEVDVDVDGGAVTAFRTDPSQPTVADVDGELWNLSVFSCDGDAGS